MQVLLLLSVDKFSHLLCYFTETVSLKFSLNLFLILVIMRKEANTHPTMNHQPEEVMMMRRVIVVLRKNPPTPITQKTNEKS